MLDVRCCVTLSVHSLRQSSFFPCCTDQLERFSVLGSLEGRGRDDHEDQCYSPDCISIVGLAQDADVVVGCKASKCFCTASPVWRRCVARVVMAMVPSARDIFETDPSPAHSMVSKSFDMTSTFIAFVGGMSRRRRCLLWLFTWQIQPACP